jgi:hypothetical protein
MNGYDLAVCDGVVVYLYVEGIKSPVRVIRL